MSAEHVRQAFAQAQRYVPPDDNAGPGVTWRLPEPLTADEMARAALTPRCIVADYLFADVALLAAPGGTGKTTASLHEAACIALGLPVWGLRVVTSGVVLFITAEDRREHLAARLREVCAAMRLSSEQMEQVRKRVLICDCTAAPQRLTVVLDDVVDPSQFGAQIVAACRQANVAPVLIQFDPAVSFGVGEARTNDAEHGLITAARVIVTGLDCCVRLVHHTGKSPALEGRTDQYAGRGGSALADGSRMVAVMQPADAAAVLKATGRSLRDGESAIALHRPKLSHAPPQGDRPLYLVRRGYAFEAVQPLAAEARAQADADAEIERERELRGALLDAADAAMRAGAPLTQSTLVATVRGYGTERKRAAVTQLVAENWLYEGHVSPGWRLINNRRRTWLVRLTDTERDALRADGALPPAATRPPPSVALPPQREAA